MKINGFEYRYEFPYTAPPIPYGIGLGDPDSLWWIVPPCGSRPSRVWQQSRLPVEDGIPESDWVECEETEYPALHAVAQLLGNVDYHRSK